MRFETKNISGAWLLDSGMLWVHLNGSGKLLLPFHKNDWVRTNFALCNVGGVHFGYLIAAMRVIRHLAKQLHQVEEVRISGHSLGGAVAEVMGVLLTKLGKHVKVDNYGGPAPFSRRYEHVPIEAYWWQCGNDVVPYLMFWNKHAGVWKWKRGVSWNPIVNHVKGYL